MTATAPPALAGIRVLDLSRVLAGPWCTMVLGDLGAEIIKVENPAGGDDTRSWGALVGHGLRTYYLCANRNKRAIAVDISTAEGQALIRDLARVSDVVVENYKLGTLERYGLDYASLSAINPRLIYCSISGYGRTGPSAARMGYDFLIQGESGLMSVTGEPDGRPMKAGAPIADIMTGNYAVQAVLAALFARERTGAGQSIDISLYECALANLGPVSQAAVLLDRTPRRYGTAHSDIVPYDAFPAQDGELIIAVANDGQFRRLCGVLGVPELGSDPRFRTVPDRAENRVALYDLLIARLRTRPRAEWLALLAEGQVPAGEVRTLPETLASEDCTGREVVQEIPHPLLGTMKLIRSPLRLDGTPVVTPTAPPALGEHTDKILHEVLGLDPARIATLRQGGIVA